MMETVLVVDDEDGVRRTFHEWLAGMPGIRVFAAADAEAALLLANEHSIDLAVLDWNLGSGSDGLKLLEDLVDFQPDIVAILVTGFANQATPLDALRMGVRDYLDKNHDLTRETFLAAVRKQLDQITPAKRQRELNQQLGEFRETVQKVLPLVRGSAALNDPVPLPAAIHGLFRFLLRSTGATDGALIVRHAPPEGAEMIAAYGIDGRTLPTADTRFHRSLAASVLSLQEPCVMTDFTSDDSLDLMLFERNRTSILAAPLPLSSTTQVVLELFDKPNFTDADKLLLSASSDLASELLRQALAERNTHRLLFDAVEAALRASEQMSDTLNTPPPIRSDATATPLAAPSRAVLDRLKHGLSTDVTDADTGLRLIEAIRVLAVRHGQPAIDHCLTMVESVRKLLEQTQG
jgi:two-component system, NtrC family, nitrogen regulation response regulator NtrX